ncbi:hypothetical protein SAMN04487949_2006 [Halogranum gelatinilyticum]|uniref:Uncharacterized protein n=1 Tax=Halogranum gelatinilyticum TaxID=660521 RepID=A0A1G9U390_9EURY|nr:hypothetical protein [Halogranum gelatinilyticum]SDM53995.1 hypothetical protein SAMN04487949_2006 [Halogranum gelatinilyticum]
MSRHESRFAGDARLLHRQAIRLPLLDADDERQFHRTMSAVADAQERKAALLRDPETSVLDAYERQLDGLEASYRQAAEVYTDGPYEAAAQAYSAGERDDGTAAFAAYLLEAVWRLQQMFTIHDMAFFPLILRYPRSRTVNVRFVRGGLTDKVHWYESPEHSTEELADEYADVYRNESLWSQKEAANEMESTARLIREEFPDPEETSPDERRTGGIVSVVGRRGSAFCTGLETVAPNPDRFDDAVTEPTVVEESPVARRTAAEWLADDAVLL